MLMYVCLNFQVRPVAEDEMFKVLHSGKRKKKAWKRMVTKVTFVGPSFTRKPPKYERFIRPSGESPVLYTISSADSLLMSDRPLSHAQDLASVMLCRSVCT